MMSSLLLGVSNFADKRVVVKDSRSDFNTLVLPASFFAVGAQDVKPIDGVFTVSTGQDVDPIYAFLPYYVGTVEIRISGEICYVSPFPKGARFIPKVNNAAIEILSVDRIRTLGPSKNVEVSISVFPDGGGLAVLSNIYVGKAQDFASHLQLSYLYYDVIRNAVLGVQIFLLALGVILFRAAKVRQDFFAPLLILAYLISYGAGAVVSQLRPDIDVSAYIVASTPMISLALFLYGWCLCGGTISNVHRTAFNLFIGVWFTFVVAANLFGVNLRFINVFLSAPSIVIALILVTVMCANRLAIQRSVEVQMMLFGSISLMLLMAHDVTFRVGLHSNGIAMSPLGSLAFFAVLSYSAIRQYLISQKGLSEANATLTQSLRSQSNQLKQEFEKTARLMQVSAAQEETARMTRELHDGVLTYLGLINIISESGASDSKEQIGHLSRIATNEIRVILDSRPNESASLAIALSSLRQNMVDPLSLQNIDVEWSIAELLSYGPLGPKPLMDVVRIVQEAIHNAVVRAECKSLCIVAEKSEGTYTIRISNFGGKTYSHEEKLGRGITNMKERAAKLGGSLSIHPKDTGASLILTLPYLKY